MWSDEYAAEVDDVSAEAIWAIWADVEKWGEWNPDIATARIDGPFEVGATITMQPHGWDPITVRLLEVKPQEIFVDETEVDGLIITIAHGIERLDGGRLRIVYKTDITGPDADEKGAEVGGSITESFPQTVTQLVERARG